MKTRPIITLLICIAIASMMVAAGGCKSSGATHNLIKPWHDNYSRFSKKNPIYPVGQLIAIDQYGIPSEIKTTTDMFNYRAWVYRQGSNRVELFFCPSGEHLTSIRKDVLKDDIPTDMLMISASHCSLCTDSKNLITTIHLAKEAQEYLRTLTLNEN
jgi:hypothetical protein